MAKCIRCGKKGLFLKLYRNAYCKNCMEIIREEEKQVSDAKEELQRINTSIEQATLQAKIAEETARRADELLEKAKEEARSEALDLAEKRTIELNTQADDLIHLILIKNEELQKLEARIESQSKKAKTAENRIAKAQQLYDSMRYALEAFDIVQSTNDPYYQTYSEHFTLDLSEYRPDIKSLSVKDLRSLFKKNTKAIQDLTDSYKSHYTTKANAAIYQLMTMALDAELTNILHDLSFGKLEDGIDRVRVVTNKYYEIAREGNQTIASTLRKFIGQLEYLYIEAIKIEYEYYTQQARIREEQRALREQMRQEAEERKQLEQQRKQVENEEKKYQQEIDRVKEQMAATHAEDPEVEKLRKRLAELEGQLNAVETKKADIINLQNGKAGTVYIISNIGSFGDNVYKVGMTRRLEPQDRVNELGDASVPFPFDVHSFIFSEDAVALETKLHQELNNRRVNKVNLRKEFFNITIEELRTIVEQIDPTAPFTETALAEQYRQSLSMGDTVVGEIPLDSEDENEAV